MTARSLQTADKNVSEPTECAVDEDGADVEEKVEAFDNLTDVWMEPAEAGVTLADVESFVETFRQVPRDRQDECIHRAVNLIPDENVMLLAGVLMDKAIDAEIVEIVFGDILNRGDEVKDPILRQILKNRAHPCWEDVQWLNGEKD